MSIWDRIREALSPSSVVPEEIEHQLRLATGALLLEMCRADFKVMVEERESIASAIRRAFDLSPEETRELMQIAEAESECAVSLQIYTSLIKEYSSEEQKRRLIEDLWRVAWADGELHSLEENLISRIGRLLELSDRVLSDIRRRFEQTHPPDERRLPA
ncbi:MAG: TerB family tellurite resistance protein [Pseudomonadota bacterium]